MSYLFHYYICCDVNVDEDSDEEEPIKFGISSMLEILMVMLMLLAMVPLMMIVMMLKKCNDNDVLDDSDDV